MIPKLLHKDPFKKVKLFWYEQLLITLWLSGWIKKYPFKRSDEDGESKKHQE